MTVFVEKKEPWALTVLGGPDGTRYEPAGIPGFLGASCGCQRPKLCL